MFEKTISVIKWPFIYIKSLFTSRSKRIKASLKVLKALKAFKDSKIDDAIIQVVSTLNMTIGSVVSAGSTALDTILPELIEALNIMDISSDASVEEIVKAISLKLNDDNTKEADAKTLKVIYNYASDKKITEKEAAIIILTYEKQ